jgi:hypothetical protein
VSDGDDFVVVLSNADLVALLVVPWSPPPCPRPARGVALPVAHGLHDIHAVLSRHARSPPLHTERAAA